MLQGFGDEGGDDLVLQKVVGGTATDLGSSPITQARARNIYHDLRVDIAGSNIKVWFNGVLQYDVNDTTFASGTAGLLVNAMAGNTGFDDVDIQTVSGAADVDEIHYRWRNDDGPEASGGAIALDGAPTSNTYGSVTSATVGHTVSAGSNRLLLVGVSYNNDNSEVVNSVVWKDGLGDEQSLTPVGAVESVDDARVEIWSLVAPNPGTANVRVTFDTSLLQGGVVGAMSFTGVDQGTPLGTFVSDFA